MNYFLFVLSVLVAHISFAQHGAPATFTRGDTLRGMLTPLRTCYDVKYYHLSVAVDTASRSIAGFTAITFEVMDDFTMMQVDLVDSMRIERIILDDTRELAFERELTAVYITIPEQLNRQNFHTISIQYSGKPAEAKRPPWDGGFTWARDKNGNLWVSVTCQGDGASLWWPNKDHQSDEPDSMLISVAVPSGFMNVSNGRLRAKEDLENNLTRFDWFVSYPINNYNVTLNIAQYAHFNDVYLSGNDTLTLDYYVQPYNIDKARRQFEQVKPMMACFEKHFGQYPFIRDGYKLVESPHLGMEHQSAVAYGNEYLQGYRGTSSSEVGIEFDYIIIHETAHEWWGNSVTSNDIADMWIHEGFGTYSEAVYVECLFGYDKAMSYVNGKRVFNDRPIIGPRNVNTPGSGDMYSKGQFVLNTLRHVIDNDSLWWDIVKSIAEEFKYSQIDGEDIFKLVNRKTGTDYSYFFEQYLRQAKLPKLEVAIRKKAHAVEVRYRWVADVKEFRMPVKVTAGDDRFVFITPTTEWQTTRMDKLNPQNFRVAVDQFFIEVRKTVTYVDP
ncbi:MAG: M1 family metallopeptidase [Bacteroidota bacterium]